MAWRFVIAMAAASVVASPSLAWADDEQKHRVDHEIARQALLRGEIMSLEMLLVEVRKTHAGDFVGVELDRKHGQWLYTIKLLTTDGKLLKVRADARTGKAIESKKGKD